MKFITLIVVSVLFGCAKKVDDIQYPSDYLNLPMVRNVDPAMESLVSKFEEEFNVSVYYTVYFVPLLQKSEAGQCVKWNNGERYVQIDPAYFQQISVSRREQLVYHELGHCSLNLNHDPNMISFANVFASSQWPESIMNPTSFNDSQAQVYEMERSYYINQMQGMR
jgi:hypothetical protein